MAFTSNNRNNSSNSSANATLVAVTDADKAKVKAMAGRLLGFYPAMTEFAKTQGYKLNYRVIAGTEGVYGYIVVKDSSGEEIGKRQFTDNTEGFFSIYGKKVGKNYISYSYADVSDALLKILFSDYLTKQGLYDRNAGIVDVEEDEVQSQSQPAENNEELPL